LKTGNTSEIGKTTKCMEKAEFNGLMEKFMMENIKTIENMVSGHLAGLMDENTQEVGKTVNNTVKVSITYQITAKK
jgi:hypothetical protein